MFSFFKKKADPKREHLGGFQDSFTKEQKAAILEALIVISKSDGSVHPKEMQEVAQTVRLLGIESNDPVFESVAGLSKDDFIRILNSLDRSQKEWFVVAVHQLIIADRKIEDIEIAHALTLFKEIGISPDDFVQIIQKTELIMKKFEKSNQLERKSHIEQIEKRDYTEEELLQIAKKECGDLARTLGRISKIPDESIRSLEYNRVREYVISRKSEPIGDLLEAAFNTFSQVDRHLVKSISVTRSS